MNFRIYTGFEPQVLKVSLRTDKPQSIRLRVYDAERDHTVLTDRYKTITGDGVLYVRMPLVGKNITCELYNEAFGNRNQQAETTFQVLGIERMPLERRMDAIDMRNRDLRSFIPFFSRLCYNVGHMTEGMYVSDDKRFKVALFEELRSRATGQVVNTPARVGEQSGLMEFSLSQLRKMTVPMRFAIGMHEFSHFYLNEVKSDEVEADLNALLIYLSLGFPHIEASQAFLETFKGADTAQNRKRALIIRNFINDFENNKIDLSNGK